MTNPTPALATRLESILNAALRQNPRLPGISIEVHTSGQTIRLATGYADLPRRVPLTPEHTFRIASQTKTFTAAAIFKLIERRQLQLDDPLTAHLSPPYPAILRAGGYDPSRITIRHLLQHTSGLYDFAAHPLYPLWTFLLRLHWTRLGQVRYALLFGKPLCQPGEAHNYSDTGYNLLSEVIEHITGQPQAAAYRSLLDFGALGIIATWFESLESMPEGAGARAHQYSGRIDGYYLHSSFDLYGGGGLVSNCRDLCCFYQALLAGRVINAASLENMKTIFPAKDARPGMGIFQYSIQGADFWGHGGFWGSQTVINDNLCITISVNQASQRKRVVFDLLSDIIDLFR